MSDKFENNQGEMYLMKHHLCTNSQPNIPYHCEKSAHEGRTK